MRELSMRNKRTSAGLKASSMTIEAGKQWLPGLPQTGGKQVSAR
jgi:hypothetical protein